MIVEEAMRKFVLVELELAHCDTRRPEQMYVGLTFRHISEVGFANLGELIFQSSNSLYPNNPCQSHNFQMELASNDSFLNYCFCGAGFRPGRHFLKEMQFR